MKNDKAEIVKQQLAERFIHCLDDKKEEVYQNKLLNKQLQKEYQTPTKEHKEKESERDL